MKDSYYFPHDYHARHDPKLERLRMDIGPVGDGIYWNLVEMLYEEGGYLPLKDIPLLAKTLNTTAQLIEKIIKDSELFIVNCDKFYSKSLLYRLKHINAKRRKSRVSGKIGGLANAKRTLSERVAIKESKVKERKERKVKESRAAQTDQEFLESLKTNPAFKGIDIDQEFFKMDAWLSARPGKQKTRRFIVGWLNRVEKPVNMTHKTTLTKQQAENIHGLNKFMEDLKNDKRSVSEGVIDVDSDIPGNKIQLKSPVADTKRH